MLLMSCALSILRSLVYFIMTANFSVAKVVSGLFFNVFHLSLTLFFFSLSVSLCLSFYLSAIILYDGTAQQVVFLIWTSLHINGEQKYVSWR